MIRWQHTKMERYLMGVVGLLATYQGLHVLEVNGFWPNTPLARLNGFADASIAGLCFMAILLIQVSSSDRHQQRIKLRIAEAESMSPRLSTSYPTPRERTALAVMGITATGEINMWHQTAEEFFGWKAEEVIGTRMPFKDIMPKSPPAEAGLPGIIGIRTKRDEDLEALAWFMPVPGEASNLVLLLDYRKARKTVPSFAYSAGAPPLLTQEWLPSA